MLYIVRHGQTELNSAHVLQGSVDAPLDERGIEQAEAAARALAERGIVFSHVFSSPLTRAVQTAGIIAPDAPMETDDRLLEMHYGPFEGADLTNLPPELKTFFSDFVHNPAPEGMEQLGDVVVRVGSFIEELRGMEGNVLISTHAIAMKGILEHLTPGSNGSYWSKFIGNCAVYAAETDGMRIGVPFELELV